jgi:8-oxo-dGTP pyrophosphatase MutT (NUDIX family)
VRAASRAVTLDRTEVLQLVGAFDPGANEQARASAQRIQSLLDRVEAPFTRTTFDPGHITASGLVLTPDSQSVLLVYHEGLERWLQPGGHLEPSDRSLMDAARREVLEETGIELGGAAATLVSLDVHEIPAARGEPSHFHHDFMFRFRLDRDAAPAPGTRAVWCPLAELDRYGVDGPLLRGVERALS